MIDGDREKRPAPFLLRRLGDWRSEHAVVATRRIDAVCAKYRVSVVSETAQTVPDILVVWIEHPDACASDDIGAIVDGSPLATLIVAAGPLCAAIGRTRGAWPAASVVAGDFVANRVEKAILGLHSGSRLRLADTASRGEVFAHDYLFPTTAGTTIATGRRVWIDSPDGPYAAMLRLAVSAANYETVARGGIADCAICDLDPIGTRLPGLREYWENHPGVKCVCVSGEASLADLAKHVGGRPVFSKLAPLTTLVGALAE